MANKSDSIIKCSGYSCFYGKNIILEDLDFNLDAGDWLYIMGPNASGKSTFLKSLLRMGSSNYKGKLLLCEKPIENYTQIKLATILAYVPQPGGPIPPFTLEEFANFGLYARRKLKLPPASADWINYCLKMVNLLEYKKMQLAALSGGQFQRACLASAIIQQTPALLLDEPDSFLDPLHARQMISLLKALHKKQKTSILMISHNLSLPFQTGGKILLLKNGKQLFFGDSEELYEKRFLLEEAFDCNFHYLAHPQTGKPVVFI